MSVAEVLQFECAEDNTQGWGFIEIHNHTHELYKYLCLPGQTLLKMYGLGLQEQD